MAVARTRFPIGLEDGIARLGLDIAPAPVEQLRAYLAMLERWNGTFNLVSRASLREALSRHVLDSLSVLPHIVGDRLLDVGTGAGLPGLVIAIARPGLACTLLDAGLKRIRFCRQVVAELDLTGVETVQARIESFSSTVRFTTVVSRAFASTADLVTSARFVCDSGARIISMKGARSDAEVAALAAIPENSRWVQVCVPGLAAERHLVLVDVP